jgi:hypothetical protein
VRSIFEVEDPMTEQHEPYGPQQYPPPPQQGYQYPPPQQPYGGYAAPHHKRSLELDSLLTIGGWVVLGLHALAYLYTLTQGNDFSGDFGARFFGGMPTLAQGVFWGGILLAIGVWVRREQRGEDAG